MTIFLTSISGNTPVLLNWANVCYAIRASGSDFTEITLSSKALLHVKESPKEIEEKILSKNYSTVGEIPVMTDAYATEWIQVKPPVEFP